MPDYEAMTGAEFQRAVGDAPDKWAEAFARRADAMSESISDGLREELSRWFADAMEAARKNPIKEVVGA